MFQSEKEKAKRYLAERLLQTVIKCLGRNPHKNLMRMFRLVSRAPLLPQHKEYLEEIRPEFESNPNLAKYIERILKQTDPHVQKYLFRNLFINNPLVGMPRRYRMEEEMGCKLPFTLLIDPTSKCNLNCRGCWAGKYTANDSLEFELVDRIIREAKEMGIYFIVMSGGEPLLWPDIFRLFRKHRDVAFMFYTNGTLIDFEMAEKLRETGNMTPALSLEGKRETTDGRRGEGVFDRIMEAMDHLRECGVPFGASLTVNRNNYRELFSGDFIDMLIEKGVLYCWSFHYVPVGRDPDYSLMLTPEQRAWLLKRVRHLRVKKPIQIADFWNDGSLTGGCIAGGRRYFHINARGEVEPCAFIHFAVDRIQEKSLVEVLTSNFFRSYRKEQPFSENLLRPCPLIDVPEKLRELICKSEAHPTHEGADILLGGSSARRMDGIASAWKERADREWEESADLLGLEDRRKKDIS